MFMVGSNVNDMGNLFFGIKGMGGWNALSGILNTLEERKNFLNQNPLMNQETL